MNREAKAIHVAGQQRIQPLVIVDDENLRPVRTSGIDHVGSGLHYSTCNARIGCISDAFLAGRIPKPIPAPNTVAAEASSICPEIAIFHFAIHATVAAPARPAIQPAIQPPTASM